MKVGLFIPCYINAIYPQVGVASYKILSRLGVDVDYPLDQTCCGQPMANAGFENEASRLARRFETLFQSYDYIVGPSASCVAFVKTIPTYWHKKDIGARVRRKYMICASSSTTSSSRNIWTPASLTKSACTTVATA